MSRHFFSPEMKVLLLYIFINNIEDHLSSTLTKSGKISGSMIVSRSSGSGGGGYSLSSTRTYVDNSSNRSLGRVGMPHGSMPVSRSSGNGAVVYIRLGAG
jgi:hypothetical protein